MSDGERRAGGGGREREGMKGRKAGGTERGVDGAWRDPLTNDTTHLMKDLFSLFRLFGKKHSFNVGEHGGITLVEGRGGEGKAGGGGGATELDGIAEPVILRGKHELSWVLPFFSVPFGMCSLA